VQTHFNRPLINGQSRFVPGARRDHPRALLVHPLTALLHRGYAAHALAKSNAGISTPFKISKVHNRRRTTRLSVLAGRAGQSSGWPVSLEAGSANPARPASHPRLAPPGGGNDLTDSKEATPMATVYAFPAAPSAAVAVDSPSFPTLHPLPTGPAVASAAARRMVTEWVAIQSRCSRDPLLCLTRLANWSLAVERWYEAQRVGSGVAVPECEASRLLIAYKELERCECDDTRSGLAALWRAAARRFVATGKGVQS